MANFAWNSGRLAMTTRLPPERVPDGFLLDQVHLSVGEHLRVIVRPLDRGELGGRRLERLGVDVAEGVDLEELAVVGVLNVLPVHQGSAADEADPALPCGAHGDLRGRGWPKCFVEEG